MRMMGARRWFAQAGIGAALLAGTAPALAAAPPGTLVVEEAPPVESGPRPAIWLLEDEDTKIYLFGTIHVLPAGLDWRSPALDRIVAKARELVVESYLAPGSEELAATTQLFLDADAVPILERVPAERREALRAAIAAGPIPVEAYDMMPSWAAALILGLAEVMDQYGVGDDGELAEAGGGMTGVEMVLEDAFRRAGKPIGSVEDPAQVLRDLNTLSPAVQSELLLQAITPGQASAAAVAGHDLALEAWVAGKPERLTIGAGELPAEMHFVLLRKRNLAWTDWLVDRLERPGEVLFAVGAGHLAGPDSVQRLLAERGFHARRVH